MMHRAAKEVEKLWGGRVSKAVRRPAYRIEKGGLTNSFRALKVFEGGPDIFARARKAGGHEKIGTIPKRRANLGGRKRKVSYKTKRGVGLKLS